MSWVLPTLTIVLPVISSAATWIVGSRKRNNSFIKDLQNSIDLLAEKYTDTLDKLTELRCENAELKSAQSQMLLEIKSLRIENQELKKNIDKLNEKLSSIKSFTRKTK